MSKYHATPCVVDGVRFASKAEAKRWQELVLLQKAGYIRDLKRQVPFVLAPAEVIQGRKRPALKYVADFVYFDVGKGQTITADVKGFETRDWRIKQHLMKSVHGIDISVIKA